VLSRVPRLRNPPPFSGGLQWCYVSHCSGPCLPARESSSASHGSEPRLPAQEGSSTATHLTGLIGPHALKIMKDLTGPPMRIASHVSMVWPHVFEMPDTRGIIACKMCGHAAPLMSARRTGRRLHYYTSPIECNTPNVTVAAGVQVQ
jgi:hypothetical protein